MRTLGLALTATVMLVLWGCGAGKKEGQTTKVIIEPTVVGVNVNCPEAPAACPSVAKDAQEHLKQEVKPLEHNCPKGYDLVITLPSSSKCVKESKVQTKLQNERPGFHGGKEVAAQAGCLACHRIGQDGNPGPGQDLTHIGTELSKTQIERALRNSKPPMPSFAHLPPDKFRELVGFLTLLR